MLDDYPFNQKRDTIQKDNGITPHTKDTHANTKQNSNTTNHTEKETSTKESHTDNKHEATQRENGADTEWITTRTSNNPQENKDTETTLKRDNGISDEYSPSSKEMAQSGNEKANEKGNLRDDSSHSSSDIEANVNISRDTQGHNAGIRLDETDNKRYKHDGNDDRDNSRTRIHRNVSLKKKGSVKKDTQTETTQEIPQNKIKEYSDEYENNLFALRAEQKKILAEREKLENGHPQLETPTNTQTNKDVSLNAQHDKEISKTIPTESNFTYATQETKGIRDLRNDLKETLKPILNKEIINKETGLKGVITETERNKISSKKAVDKSVANGFTIDEHYRVGQDLKNLYENATKRESHNDYKNRDNIIQVHRFTKDINVNGKEAIAKITLFEKKGRQ
ncbi:hypothetical protein XJ32_03720 [Helicobacter bilis]|uniref:Large polyvalent protein-associated domain-containing protein n=1 Tax=Helicobacter bilis TaxID=37372 RepID=A0A1Q2LGX4_9HELI|nr:hypothetical protein [Helicobacter bilis]AQQ59347.1 hypothetical protein XJ32_03720 [Helicobacter bilis]